MYILTDPNNGSIYDCENDSYMIFSVSRYTQRLVMLLSQR